MKKKICLLLVMLVSIFIFIGIRSFKTYGKLDIDSVLRSSSYSYLSSDILNYIKGVYEETGEVLLTEKNKAENKPYLNPEYVEYLNVVFEEGNGYFPDALKYDYEVNYVGTDNLPSKYDSRDVNGENYVTPLKKQFSNLCWDYAFTSVIESKLLRAGLEKNASSLDLSERMMDYATSLPITTVDIGKNPYFANYTLSSLSESGNEYRYTSALVNGMFPINEDDWQYEKEYLGKVRPEDIYDFNKIDYQVNEVHYFEDDNYNVGFDEDTNKMIKQYIMDNGAVGVSLRVGAGKNYVSYTATGEDRLNIDVNKNYLYYKDVSALYQSNDHSVSIIGWDDDYVHNICILDNGELANALNNGGTYSCSVGTLKVINGAWIIKDSAHSLYHYLAYETVNSDYYSVVDISYRDWDNVYRSTNSEMYTKSGLKYIFDKQSNVEKIDSIKFYSQNKISNLEIYIDTYDGNGEKLLTTFNSDMPGMYAISISNEIILSSDKFGIRFSGASVSQFSIFTSNMDNDIVLNIENAKVVNSFNYQIFLNDNVLNDNVIVLSGISKNVNENIDFVIQNSNGENVSYLFTVLRNYSVSNYVNSLIKFNDNVPLGEYNAYANIDGTLYNVFKININNYMEKIYGDGTIDNPYIITNPIQLDMMRLDQFSYYKLGNDIDLTYDTQNKEGLFYNNGLGWDPISYSTCSIGTSYVSCSSGFSGGFDGSDYHIIGLYINRPNEDIVGLFKNTDNVNFAGLYFRNVILKDVNIVGKNYVGGLIGYAYGVNYERTLLFENISVTGQINGNDYVGGIIGYYNGGTGLKNYLVEDTKCTSRHCLNNLFNSSTVNGNNYVGGIVGLFSTQTYYNFSNANWRSTIDANNWQNNGSIISKNNGAGLFGHIVINNGNIITLSNAINTGIVNGKSNVGIFNDLNCKNSGNTYPSCSLNLNNVYYVNEMGYNDSSLISANNVKKYSVVELTYDNIYESFIGFNEFYKKDTINDIKRIPFLKNAPVMYTNARDISMSEYDNVNLYDYVDGSHNIIYDVLDDTVASIDKNGNIVPLKNGSTKIHITSYYDGYDSYILLDIDLNNKLYTVTFNANDGSGTMKDQVFISGVSQRLNANQFIRPNYLFKGWSTNASGTSIQYRDEEMISIESDMTLYAIWEKVNIAINSYKVDENNMIIYVNVGVNKDDFSKNIEYDSNYYYTVIDSKQIDGKDILYTGGKLKIYSLTNDLYKEYIIASLGDVTGDGEISTIDYINLYNHLDNSSLLFGIYSCAADMNLDNDITTMDYITVYNILSGN